MRNESSDEEGWSDMEEGDYEDVTCLLCPSTFPFKGTWSDYVLTHMKSTHAFSLEGEVRRRQLQAEGYIRLVNGIRQLVASSGDSTPTQGEIQNLKLSDSDDDLRPVLAGDILMTLDVEEFVTNVTTDAEKLKQVESELEEARAALALMRATLERITQPADGAAEASSRDALVNDDWYFSSYGSFHMHQEMLEDRVRTAAYRDAFLLNADTFAGKRVLDVGAGSGILSLFAANVGAEVIAVERSDVVRDAKETIALSGLTVDLRQCAVENLKIEGQVDVIVSEWMGYCLLYESMWASLLEARDRWLRPGGLMLPSTADLLFAAADTALYDKNIRFWDDVYGFSMPSMKRAALEEAAVATVLSEEIVTSRHSCARFDMATCTAKDMGDVRSDFHLTPNTSSPTTINALVLWFDCYFLLAKPVTLSTAPGAPYTHWRQTVLYLSTPRPLLADGLRGQVQLVQKADDQRSFLINITLQGEGGEELLSYRLAR